MKRVLLQWILAACVVCAGVGCSTNDPENGSSGISNETNTGDDESDLVDNQTWSSSVDIVWNGSSAAVSGSVDGVTITNSDGYVSITSTAKHVVYNISGSGTGQLSIYSDYKFQLAFQGLTLSCSDGPAVNNQCHKTCYVVLNGTNALSDGGSYASSTEDRKAAFFSEGQLCFSGSGSLNITGNYKHALASDDYIRFCEGTGAVNLTARVSDGIHTNDGVIINGGTLTVTANKDGIQCDTSSVVITGGVTVIQAGDEGIAAYSTVTVSGGEVYVQAVDDAINSGGNMTISGGCVCAYSTGNDGLDANGNCYIQGGLVYAIGASAPEVAVDANSEGGYKLYVTGGTIVAIGGLESGASLSQNCYSASSWSKSTWYALTVGSDVFAFKTPTNGGSTLVVSGASTPTLASGVTPSGTAVFNGMGFYPATAIGGSSVSLSSYTPSGNQGGGPGGNPGGNPGGRPGGK